MIISSFKIENYKCFRDSRTLICSSGFNVVVGQNNSGKTTLLDALRLDFSYKPNKKTVQESSGSPDSVATIALSMTGQEFSEIILERQKWELPIPLGLGPCEHVKELIEKANQLLKKITQSSQVIFSLRYSMPAEGSPRLEQQDFLVPDVYKYELVPRKTVEAFAVLVNPEGHFLYVDKVVKSNNPEIYVDKVVNKFKNTLYFFHGERLPVGTGTAEPGRVLAPLANNLSGVLHVLHTTKPNLWQKYNELVHEVIPTICQLRVPPQGNNRVKVEYWSEKDSLDQDDLAIELDESGTGVKQVLSLLYVVLTSEFPRTIIIDEPNAFLHPGAARKLIAILKQDFPQHQYIVATHSPQIIRDSDPGTLSLVRWEEEGSTIERLGTSELNAYKACLDDVGAKLSDVFGADRILWVEGETEEICFPLLLQGKIPRLGVNMVAVRHTGDFESKRRKPEEIFELYEKVSQGNAVIPPAISFVFDREDRTQGQMADLEKRSGGKIKFLPRRSYENYLLVPSALASYISELESPEQPEVTEEQISSWLKSNGGKYVVSGGVSNEEINPSDPLWLQKVDAPKLLENLFQEITGCRFSYRKLKNSPALTKLLLKNEPGQLQELQIFLEEILESVNS